MYIQLQNVLSIFHYLEGTFFFRQSYHPQRPDHSPWSMLSLQLELTSPYGGSSHPSRTGRILSSHWLQKICTWDLAISLTQVTSIDHWLYKGCRKLCLPLFCPVYHFLELGCPKSSHQWVATSHMWTLTWELIKIQFLSCTSHISSA